MWLGPGRPCPHPPLFCLKYCIILVDILTQLFTMCVANLKLILETHMEGLIPFFELEYPIVCSMCIL
jgi:hypothetical protein